jgi:ribosomal protein L37AE/L43A
MSFGGRSRADTAIQKAAKSRRMEATKCPKCGRKGAIQRERDDFYFYEACRYNERGLCDYVKVTER